MTAVASHRHSLRDGTAADWTAVNPTLAASELGYETDTGNLKIGDGATAWNDLPYWLAAIFPLDVKLSYGALGDGSTNDYTAFSNVIAAANALGTTGLAAGAEIQVPPGHYIVDGPSLVLSGRVRMRLEQGAWITRPNTSSHTDPVIVCNGNESQVTGGKVESLVASPSGIVVIGNTTDTVFSRVAMTSGSNVVTAESAVFTAGMNGWQVGINNAGAAGARLTGYFQYVDSTHGNVFSDVGLTTPQNASATVTHQRGLFGTGGKNVNWCQVDTHVYGRNAAAGSGDIGVKFNSYPQSWGFLTSQSRFDGLVWGCDYGVVLGPEANGNTVGVVQFYKIGISALLVNNADEGRAIAGFVSSSTNSTLATLVGCVYNHVTIQGEPGGASSRGCNLDADTKNNFVTLGDNTSLGNIDLGQANTVLGHLWGPWINRQTHAYANTTGTVALASSAPLSTAHLITMSHDLTTLTLPTPPAGSVFTELRIDYIQDGTGGWKVTDPASVVWDGGVRPQFDTAANHTTSVVYTTYDNGTTWRAKLAYLTSQQNVHVDLVGGSANNTITDTTLTTDATVSANSLQVGTLLRYRIHGTIDTSASGGGTFTVRFKVNGTIIRSVQFAPSFTSGGTTSMPWTADVDVFVEATGAGGSVSVMGSVVGFNVAANGLPYTVPPASPPVSVDLSGGLQLSVSGQMGTAAAANTIRVLRASRVREL